jgi:hypothetical protein
VFVNGNLLDEVAALDAHLLLREQVLDDHVGHVLSESVPGQKGSRWVSNRKDEFGDIGGILIVYNQKIHG